MTDNRENVSVTDSVEAVSYTHLYWDEQTIFPYKLADFHRVLCSAGHQVLPTFRLAAFY